MRYRAEAPQNNRTALRVPERRPVPHKRHDRNHKNRPKGAPRPAGGSDNSGQRQRARPGSAVKNKRGSFLFCGDRNTDRLYRILCGKGGRKRVITVVTGKGEQVIQPGLVHMIYGEQDRAAIFRFHPDFAKTGKRTEISIKSRRLIPLILRTDRLKERWGVIEIPSAFFHWIPVHPVYGDRRIFRRGIVGEKRTIKAALIRDLIHSKRGWAGLRQRKAIQLSCHRAQPERSSSGAHKKTTMLFSSFGRLL